LLPRFPRLDCLRLFVIFASLIVVEMNIFMPISNKLFLQAATAGGRCGFIVPWWQDRLVGDASFQHRVLDL
jgi:glycerol-3-phosphate dehydrogenase